MDNLQKIVLELVKLGDLSVRIEEGKIELSAIINEAVSKGILPKEVIDIIGNIVCKEK
ncbi:hypothetical protein [Bacillus sp. ISL-57]|uniref:hypothetical protein n=1 Tax=Bacillus sp. ISL-57 TaxID=2819135 RepID=UPI001BE6BFB0|nr:hypothetical protein [Bacillus sp. ISL-57]MBT2718315.1 hypothetical protein [Bacillus sp. ISL-57]